MHRIRVLVADDQHDVLDYVARFLGEEFEVVGAVADGQSLLHAAEELDPHIIVLDITMPRLSGIDAARELKKRASTAKIVFLTVHEDREVVREAFDAGALGYVTKSRLIHDLPIAVKKAYAGDSFVSPALAR